MATIGTFNMDDAGNYNGAIKTLTLNVKQAILRKVDKDNDKAPDFRIFSDEERQAAQVQAAALPQAGATLEGLNFNYRISGDHPAWRPVRVFDDGRQTVIEFPTNLNQSEMPPLFVSGPDGKATDLVNYRVSRQRIVVDRLIDRAELRLGDRRGAQRVRIERTARG